VAGGSSYKIKVFRLKTTEAHIRDFKRHAQLEELEVLRKDGTLEQI
jgi:hypothetical protein